MFYSNLKSGILNYLKIDGQTVVVIVLKFKLYTV